MVHYRRGWRVGAAGLVVVGLVCVATAWAALLTPTNVIGGRGNQILPAATPGATYLAFSNSRPGHPDLYDAYVKQPGQAKVKVNLTGVAYVGNISGTTLAYSQHRIGRNSNIRLYDLLTHQSSGPAGVNTSRWEFAPLLSGDWIAFGRGNFSVHPAAYRVILRNQTTTETRVLDVHSGRPLRYLVPGGMNGDWLSWDRLTPSKGTGTSVRYQISTDQTFVLRPPPGKAHYASSANSQGDLFYARATANTCGREVNLREHTTAGTDTALARLPRGYDIGATSATDEGGGVTTVYFDRVNCATKRWDIYKIIVS
jgi:hypothetical protein